MLKKIKEFIPLILILLLASALRILFLNSVPGALGGDELHYVLTIKSVALSGQDLFGPWNIFSILAFNYPFGLPQAELSYLLMYPAVAFTNLSLFTSKITFALLSVATVFAVYLLAKQMFDKKVGLIAATITAINPWQIFIGRTSYEVVPAICFYLFGIYFLLKEKSWRILISLPFFILAFYSYIGTKVVLVPLVATVSLFVYFSNKNLPAGRQGKYLKQYVILNLACIGLVLLFAVLTLSGANRTGDLFTPADPVISSIVDEARKGSIAPSVLDAVLTNKLTVFGKIIIDKFFVVFSPSYLFISTDTFVGIYNHGLFLAIDFAFLILGLLVLFAQRQKTFWLFSALLVISTFPQIFYKSRTDIFSPHLALFLVLLIIPVAYGISYLFSKKRIYLLSIVAFVYLISVINFLNIYFFQFPLTGHFDFGSRQMANYVARATHAKNINVYVQSPSDSYLKYIYYTNKLNKNNITDIQKAVRNKQYKVENVVFLNCSDVPTNASNSASTTIVQRGGCKKVELANMSLKIAALNDGGELYAIYNDFTCSQYNLNPYPMGIKLSDFNLESLSNQKFCEVFVSK